MATILERYFAIQTRFGTELNNIANINTHLAALNTKIEQAVIDIETNALKTANPRQIEAYSHQLREDLSKLLEHREKFEEMKTSIADILEEFNEDPIDDACLRKIFILDPALKEKVSSLWNSAQSFRPELEKNHQQLQRLHTQTQRIISDLTRSINSFNQALEDQGLLASLLPQRVALAFSKEEDALRILPFKASEEIHDESETSPAVAEEELEGSLLPSEDLDASIDRLTRELDSTPVQNINTIDISENPEEITQEFLDTILDNDAIESLAQSLRPAETPAPAPVQASRKPVARKSPRTASTAQAEEIQIDINAPRMTRSSTRATTAATQKAPAPKAAVAERKPRAPRARKAASTPVARQQPATRRSPRKAPASRVSTTPTAPSTARRTTRSTAKAASAPVASQQPATRRSPRKAPAPRVASTVPLTGRVTRSSTRAVKETQPRATRSKAKNTAIKVTKADLARVINDSAPETSSLRRSARLAAR
jgi:hypothetical protein